MYRILLARLGCLFIGSWLCFGCSPTKHMEPVTVQDLNVPDKLVDQFTTSEIPPVEEVKPKPITPKTVVHAKERRKVKEVSPSQVSRHPAVMPFHEGEKFVMDITYFGMIAGTLTVEVLPDKFIQNRRVYHIRAVGKTVSIFSMFYRVNDVAETFFDAEGLFSHKFSLHVDESKQQREVLELYDQDKKTMYYWNKLDRFDKGQSQEQFTKEIMPFTQDILSAGFYVRSLPLRLGETYSFPVMTNGKYYEVSMEVVRRERIHTAMGEFDALVLKPEASFEGILKKKGDIFIWVSDDVYHRFLKIDAKVKIGSVVAYIKEIKSDMAR